MSTISKTLFIAGLTILLGPAFAENTGVGIGTPQDSQSVRSPAETETMGSWTQGQVRDAQSALSKKGYKLQVDGVVGKNTEDAIRSFQQAEGLEVTGTLNSETLRALDLDTSSDRFPSSVRDDDTSM